MKSQISSDNILVALDIGTTKICILVAQKIADTSIEIIGIGHAPSRGVARGVVTDIAQAVESIKHALKEAELMAGCKIESVGVGISGAHIHAINSNGIVPIKHGTIKPLDIANVITSAKAIILPDGQQILHVLPQYYIIDSQQQIMDPLGMAGIRMEAKVHIITGSIASVQNIISCCQMSGVNVSDIILEPLASAESVLSSDERELGVGILDIGGGTSDFAIYQQGTIRYTKIFPIAGNLITNDIALCLRATIKDAERVKRQFGNVILNEAFDRKFFEIEMAQGSHTQRVPIVTLTKIIEARIAELLFMLKAEIAQNQLTNLMPAGLVITGGGSLLNGIQEATSRTLKIPARTGNPMVPLGFRESLENPIYATGHGLLLYMLKNKKKSMEKLTGNLITCIFGRMKSWVSDFF